MTEKFDIAGELISRLRASDAQKIESLERELQDAYRFIAYLIDRFGEDRAGRTVIKVNPWELGNFYDAELIRWDDAMVDGFYVGVRTDEH